MQLSPLTGIRWVIVTIAAVALFSWAAANDSMPVLASQVAKIVDGDTLDVQLAPDLIRIRLYGIDAPERSQPHGKEATATLSRWVMGKQVQVEPLSQDGYDRIVGIVRLGDINVNAAMIRSGDAWGI